MATNKEGRQSDSRDGRVHQLKMSLEVRGDGVLHRLNCHGTSSSVVEDREVRIEKLVSLAHRDGEAEPVSSGGDGGCLNVVLLQPGVHSRNSVRSGSDVLLDLKRVQQWHIDTILWLRTSSFERCWR